MRKPCRQDRGDPTSKEPLPGGSETMVDILDGGSAPQPTPEKADHRDDPGPGPVPAGALVPCILALFHAPLGGPADVGDVREARFVFAKGIIGIVAVAPYEVGPANDPEGVSAKAASDIIETFAMSFPWHEGAL